MGTMLLDICPDCGRDTEEGKSCGRETWLLRRRELLLSILGGMGVKVAAAGSEVLLVDEESEHLIRLDIGGGK